MKMLQQRKPITVQYANITMTSCLVSGDDHSVSVRYFTNTLLMFIKVKVYEIPQSDGMLE